jgi:hypothetical protein
VLQFTTEFGGSSDEFPGGIAVDTTGIYVSGTTDSSDFPVTLGAAQTTFVGGGPNGSNDAFAAKLTLAGSITWATFINGSDSTTGLAVAIDSSQNVYVVGETFAPDLSGVTVKTLPNGSAINLGSGSGADDGYIVKVNSTGSAFDLGSYIGGSNGEPAWRSMAAGTFMFPAKPYPPIYRSQRVWCKVSAAQTAHATRAATDRWPTPSWLPSPRISQATTM